MNYFHVNNEKMNQPLMGDYMLIPNHISLKISFAVSPLLQLFHKIVAIKKKKQTYLHLIGY